VYNSSVSSQEALSTTKGKIPGLLEVAGGVKFLWQKQENETKTLHDHIYNKVEEVLKEGELLIRIPGHIEDRDIEDGGFRSMLCETSFILVTGQVYINDYGRMEKLFEKFKELCKECECSCDNDDCCK